MIIFETSQENYSIIEQSGIMEQEGVCKVDIKMAGKIPRFDTYDEVYRLAHSDCMAFNAAAVAVAAPIAVSLIQVLVPVAVALIDNLAKVIIEHIRSKKEFKIIINGKEVSFKGYSADDIDKIKEILSQCMAT